MTMRKPEIISVVELVTASSVKTLWTLPNGKKWWGPARAYGWNQLRLWGRFKAAWLVFTGRADALTWPSRRSPTVRNQPQKGTEHEYYRTS